MRKTLWVVPAILLGTQLSAVAAEVDTVPPGAEISVRTNEPIQMRDWDRGRIYRGEIARDVIATDGDVAFPRGAAAELIVRQVENGEMVVDLESVMVNGRRFVIDATSVSAESRERAGVGGNERTAKYVGGGALLGSIIGAIAGGGKGAVIGAAAGAAGGASAQVMTRGREIRVPTEALLTFRLERPLRFVEGTDDGSMRNGHHYHDYRDDPIYRR